MTNLDPSYSVVASSPRDALIYRLWLISFWARMGRGPGAGTRLRISCLSVRSTRVTRSGKQFLWSHSPFYRLFEMKTKGSPER